MEKQWGKKLRERKKVRNSTATGEVLLGRKRRAQKSSKNNEGTGKHWSFAAFGEKMKNAKKKQSNEDKGEEGSAGVTGF